MIGDRGSNLVEHIIIGDMYHLRDCRYDDFEYVFDIGSNVGFFSYKQEYYSHMQK